MHNIKQNNTSKKLILLIIIFLFGFISLYTVNIFVNNLINSLDNKVVHFEQKSTIGKFIYYDILEIKALISELSTNTSNQTSRDSIGIKIDEKLKIIEKTLDILKNGGTLNRKIYLNITNQIKTIKYEIVKNKEFLLKGIDISKINYIKEKINLLLIQKERFLKEKNTQKVLNNIKELKRYYNTLTPFFANISKNIEKVLYDSDIEYKALREEIELKKERLSQIKLSVIIITVLIVLILGYFIIRNLNRDSKLLFDILQKQEKQEKATRAILDAQSNIIIVSNGAKMIDANQPLYDFFPKYKNFEEFNKNIKCICNFFETKIPNEEYIIKKEYNGLNWNEYIEQSPNNNFKVIMKKNGVKHHFLIKATKTTLDENTGESVVIITLNDITQEINSHIKLESMNKNLELIVKNKTKELQELNENLEQKIIIETQKVRDKEKQMTEQARFAAMGEMIGNIAHQWRQPLSAINTTASGMLLQLQLGISTNEEIEDSYNNIMDYVSFLTQTIEDFRGFFKEDKENIDFNILETLTKTMSITHAVYKDYDINIIKDDFNDVELISNGMPSELSQVFLNILNNAKDVLVEKNIKEKYVDISYDTNQNNNIIYIHDIAGGIPEDIIGKIFDPYFTTKHQSQGTGIGLYMSKDIVEKHMLGKLTVSNKALKIKDNNYFGACFKIEIPKKA
ncbi:MAG: HAMP domain-containing sensor histidine kinase [Campylobacterota bacterium]|nr:HAMP domain-containing sensor histidine kinase [Campylobacterota bacterium]